MRLPEQLSKSVQKKYVQIPEGFLFEDGIVFTPEEIRKIPPESFAQIYADRLQKEGSSYDYDYTRLSGEARKLPKNKVKSPEKSTITKAAIITKQEEAALPVLIGFLFAIGAIAVGLSCYYTRAALLMYLPSLLALLLSCIMVCFNSISFNLIVIFWKRRAFLVAGTFALLFVVSTSFSMTNTVQVNFGRYYQVEKASLEEHKSINRDRASLANITEQINSKKEEIINKEALIQYYTEKGYNLGQLLRDKQDLIDQKTKLITKKTAIIERSPEAVTTTDVKDITFFDKVSDLLKSKGILVKASTVQFWQSVLPALFIDIIAPFSLATGVQLLGEKKRKYKE